MTITPIIPTITPAIIKFPNASYINPAIAKPNPTKKSTTPAIKPSRIEFSLSKTIFNFIIRFSKWVFSVKKIFWDLASQIFPEKTHHIFWEKGDKKCYNLI